MEHLKLKAIDLIKLCEAKFPQSKLNGSQNQWIVKPGGLSRGRNIQIFSNFHEILAYTDMGPSNGAIYNPENTKFQAFGSKSWVVQKYIENPLLIINRKFDIRAWVLVASWNPLQIYLYKDCYIRFSASDYDPKNVKNLFMHLTNNSISKHCSEKQTSYFAENMWSLDQFKTYLSSQFQKDELWESKLLPQMKDIIKLSMLSAWSKVDWRENSIGLYGYDVLIDSDLKMWLLEINLCPTMEHSTKVTKHLVPKMMEDLCKVIIDGKELPEEGVKKSTGDYDLIYEGVRVREALKNKTDFCIEGRRITK